MSTIRPRKRGGSSPKIAKRTFLVKCSVKMGGSAIPLDPPAANGRILLEIS